MPGFIHDNLEIKFLILYLAAHLTEPVPFETLLDLALCDDGVGYFDFNQCLRELVATEHLTVTEEGLYAATEKGVRNSKICESGIPYSVRLKCDRNLDACNRALRRKRQVRASWRRHLDGTCTLHLSLDDDLGCVLDVKMAVPREDLAQILADRFRAAPERIYTDFLAILMDRRGPDDGGGGQI